MKKLVIALGLAISLTACTNSSPTTPIPSTDFTGVWEGIGSRIPYSDRLVLTVTSAAGQLSGTLRIDPDTSDVDVVAPVIGQASGDRLTFTVQRDMNTAYWPEGCEFAAMGYSEARNDSVQLRIAPNAQCGNFFRGGWLDVVLYR